MRITKETTWTQLVQHYLPGVSDDLAGYILWNETAYPFNDLRGIRRQLKALARKTNSGSGMISSPTLSEQR